MMSNRSISISSSSSAAYLQDDDDHHHHKPCRPTPYYAKSHGCAAIPYGDGKNSVMAARPPSADTTNVSWKKKQGTLSIPSSIDDLPQPWLVKILYACVVFSWIIALPKSYRMGTALAELEALGQNMSVQLQDLIERSRTIKTQIRDDRRFVKKLQAARNALEHEVRLLEEMNQVDMDMTPTPMDSKFVKAWFEHRKQGLAVNIDHLQQRLESTSHDAVLERFGPGPHRVRFTAEFADSNTGSLMNHTFVVQLAPLGVMPHSIHFFLEMVEAKIFDSTMFLHREKSDHVIAATPIDYKSQHIKYNHLNYMGWTGLGYPEYSEKYPHKKYTIGFAARGPTFYINTFDNTETHGPGGQGHHFLPGDADPCFGYVSQGQDVVDSIAQLEMHHQESARDSNLPWSDEKHTTIRLVSIDII